MTQLDEPYLCSPCCLMSDVFVVLFIVGQCNHFIFLNIFFLILVKELWWLKMKNRVMTSQLAKHISPFVLKQI